MTNNNFLNKSSTINNSVRSKNFIKINMQEGKLRGNLLNLESIELNVVNVCADESLDLSCENNSQYLPLI